MDERKKGCFGCLTSIFSFVFFISTLIVLFLVIKNIFIIPPKENIPISNKAANNCRRKLAMLVSPPKNGPNLISLKEIELNSFFHQEMQKSNKEKAIIDMYIDIEEDNMQLSGTIRLSEISLFNIANLHKFINNKLLRIKVSGDLRIKKGKLTLEPEKVTLGKQRFPVALIVPLMKKINEQMFDYNLPSGITNIKLKKNTIYIDRG